MITKENIIHTVSIIEASDGQNVHTGTGFFYSYKKDEMNNYALVSNKHIMSGCNNFKLYIPVLSKQDKSTQIVTYDFKTEPTLHPEYDLAAIGINTVISNAKYKYGDICVEFIRSSDILSSDIKIIPIETVYMSGYPCTLVGDKYKCPITKQGITATPITSEYNNRQEFLTDIISINGYSGSPVFLEKDGQLFLSGIHHSSLTKNNIEIGLSVVTNYKILKQFLLA